MLRFCHRYEPAGRPSASEAKATSTLGALLLAMGAMAAAGCAAGDNVGSERTGESREALSLTKQTPIGDVVVIAPPEAAPVTGLARGGWAPVPGLSGAIQTAAASNVTATVTAEMFGGDPAFLRARLDGVPSLSTVTFMGTGRDDVRAFTFVFPGVAAGQHTVEIEWSTCVSCTAGPQIRDRTLTLHAASSTQGQGRLAVNQEHGSFIVQSEFQAVPGLNATLSTAQSGPLAITYSGDSGVGVDGMRLVLQAVLDGVVVEEAIVQENATSEWVTNASRSYTFVIPNVAAGTHSVELRAATRGAPVAVIFDRTLAVASAPSTSAAGGMVASSVSWPTLFNNTAWADVQGLSTSFSTSAGASTAIIEAGGELGVNDADQSTSGRFERGRMFFRALIDGVPARPGDVVLTQGSPSLKAQSFSFTVDNLAPGGHFVQLQAAVDAPSITGFFGKRFVRVHHARRSGAAVVQPFAGMRPKHRVFDTLVICFDPLRPGHARPTNAQLRSLFESSNNSVKGWWAENAAPHVMLGAVTYLGCDDKGWFNPPPERQGNYYWDTGTFELMWQDALRAADPSFDFHARDANGNGNIDPDELLVAIVRPQNDPYGTTRGTSLALDGQSAPLGVHLSDLYLSANTNNRTWSVGLIGHEFSHSLNGAFDLYSPCPPETDAGAFSVMSYHFAGTHLDPWHKLKSGLATPDALETTSFAGTLPLTLTAVERGSHEVTVLYDRNRAEREYFIIENRLGADAKSTYDQPLGNNVVLWHVIEDSATRQTYPFVDNRNCRIPVRFLKALNASGASHDFVWADGTPAQIRITLTTAPGTTTNVQLEKTPCTPAPISTTCAGKQCGPATDNCGTAITCPNTCSSPAACGFGGVGPNSCGCISNGDPCRFNQCSGTAVDNCGTVFQCHASCGLEGACPSSGGQCRLGFCQCRQGPPL